MELLQALQQAFIWGAATVGLSIGVRYARDRWPAEFQRYAIAAMKIAIVLGIIGIGFILASVPNADRF